MIGQRLGHYRILAKIGAGGMGEVYRAQDEQLDRDVAVKVLPSGMLVADASRKQFRIEALALAKLNHPNIETIFEFSSQDGVDFLVIELIPGQPLSLKLKDGPLPQQEVVRLASQLAEGLAAAHEQDVIHRDLKPGNLFVTPDGRLKILDFGLAKLLHPKLANDVTRSVSLEDGTVSGTVPYMSPEQLRGESADARSDIYAAGAVLYEMATGQRPFPQTQGPQLMGAILHQSPALPRSVNPSIVSSLERVVLKALEKEPSLRYQTARELRAALEGLFSTTAASVAVPKVVPANSRAIRSGWLPIAGVAFGVAALAVGGWLYYARKAHALTEKDTIVLSEFANSTGDVVFDDTLKQGLSVQLAQSPFLNILSDEKVNSTLGLMGRSGDRLTRDVALEVCQRTESKAMLAGSIGQIGKRYSLVLNAVNCATGDSVASTEAQAADKDHVLDGLGKIATDMRKKLGESLTTIQKFDTPVAQVTTPSLEALNAYSVGMRTNNDKGDAESIPFFKRAIELDPNFAVAYANLGSAYSNLGQAQLASESGKKAFELRERVSEREKFNISALYYEHVTGEVEKAIQTYEQWAQSYPRDSDAHANLGANYALLGQFDKALPEMQESLRLEPNDVANYSNLGELYLALNRLDEAKSTFDQALARNLDAVGLRLNVYYLAFLRADEAEMERQVAWGAAKPGDEDPLLSAQSDTDAYYGRLGQARELSRRAVDSARRADEKETAATWQANDALREAEFGNSAQARRAAGAARAMASGRNVHAVVALALARADDNPLAQKLSDDLGKIYPANTYVNFYWLPTIRSAIEISRKNTAKAIGVLKLAAPYELGAPPFLGNMYPVYVRGEAYLLAHNGSAAAGEFLKMIDHPGIMLNFPTGALAHLELGRAYAMTGDTAKARSAYQDFFVLWKDADPDIPILIAAKSEYAKLK